MASIKFFKEKIMDEKSALALNRQDRKWYVKFWANYVKTHKDSEWGRQQNVFINSLMRGAKQNKMSAREYLKVKERK